MAQFRLTKKDKPKQAEPVSPQQSASLLQQAGGTALSGLHTLGSLLSAPSRRLWGNVSAATGHDAGNMSLLDSTGGKELSHVLGEQGVIAPNDESKWEFMPGFDHQGRFNPGDIGRGLIDIAGDPTSWLLPLGLTQRGIGIAKQGRHLLAPTLLQQIRNGERGLVGLTHPLSAASHGAVGTGQAVADAIHGASERTGFGRLYRAVADSPLVTVPKKMLHASSMGRSTAPTQRMAEGAYRTIGEGHNEIGEHVVNTARNMELMAGGPRGSDVERHMIEMGRTSPEMHEIKHYADELHRMKQDIGIPTDDLNNTVKPFSRVGPRKAARTVVLDDAGDVVHTIQNQGNHPGDSLNYLVPNQRVEHAHRRIGEGVEWGGTGAGGSHRAMGADAAIDQHRNLELFGNASTDMINRVFRLAGEHLQTLPAGLSHNEQAREIKRLIEREFRAEDLRSGTNLTGTYTTDAGTALQRTHSRSREIGNFIAANPQLAESGPFTNHVLADYEHFTRTGMEQVAKAQHALRFMGQNAAINHGEPLELLRRHGLDNPPRVREAAEALGLNANEAGQHVQRHLTPVVRQELDRNAAAEAMRMAQHEVSQRSLRSLQDIAQNGMRPPVEEVAAALMPQIRDRMILDLHLPARDYKSLTGFMDKSSPAGDGLLSSFNTLWKAHMLMPPATQVRNAGSALVQNTLTGSSLPLGKAQRDAVQLIRGQQVAAGLENHPDVARIIATQGVDETEALRRLAAVHFPAENLRDLPAGQSGRELEDIASRVPGREEIPLHRAVTGPLGALVGYRNGEHVGWNAANPLAIEGVGRHKITQLAPAMATNMIARNVEQPIRTGGWMGLMKQGYSAAEAAKKIDESQVSYGVREFSQFEKNVMKKAVPFYAFGSRQGKHVLKELASKPGGRLAQLVKSEDRAHGGDASLPDSVLSGTSIPVGDLPDGTKRVVSGFGLMSEPAVHTLGALAHGDLKSAGLDLLGMTHPFIKGPLEHSTGVSFYNRGEPLGNLDPNIGRLLSNVGVGLGLRDAHAGPVQFPGSSIVEPVVAASPFSRIVGTAKNVTDTRKGIGEKVFNNLTGVRITDISPAKQEATLLRRAEELAKSEGAHARSEVYFNKAELEQLRETNPALYKRQVELQSLLKSLKGKSKSKSGKIQLSKKAKA